MSGGSRLSAPLWVVGLLRRLPLRRRGPLFILCGLLLIFTVFGGFSIFSLRRSSELATEWTMRSAHVAAQRLDHEIELEQNGVERLARWPGVASTLELLWWGRTDIAPPWVTLNFLASDPEDFGACVFVTDPQGTVLWTKPPGLGLLNRDLSIYPEVRAALADKATRTSDLLPASFWPEPHVLISSAIQSTEGGAVGLVGTVVGAERLRRGELFGAGEGIAPEAVLADTYVVDAAGGIVTSTDPGRLFTQVDDDFLRARAASEATGFSTRRGDRVLAAHQLAVVPWHVVIEQPVSSVYKDVYLLERNLAILAVLLTLLALIVWLPFVGSFVGPIHALTVESQRIASGDLSHPVPRDGHDEVSTLAESFENMRRQLLDAKDNLEKQVVELTEMNRLKAEFIATLSHEFRTPMHIMRGYIDLILDGDFGPVPEELREPLGAVVRQFGSLWMLLESCLELVKFNAGKQQTSKTKFDLNRLVCDVMEDLAPRLQEKSLDAAVRLPEGPRWIASDEAKVERILCNLVGNAVKFTDAGKIEVWSEVGPLPEMVTVHVRDTGIGISDSDQKIIFERFRQVDGTSTRRFDGLGLGLSIASELAEMLGGSITVSSAPGAGSTFSLILPQVLSDAAGIQTA